MNAMIVNAKQAAMMRPTKTFKVRKSEYLPSAQYFVRVKNQDYNYTNNPTFIARRKPTNSLWYEQGFSS